MRFRIKIDVERCKGCDLCAAACSREVLEMSKAMNRKGYHYAVVDNGADCFGCLQCSLICPDAAIEIEQEDD